MRIYIWAVVSFLYLPIVTIIWFSFNAAPNLSEFTGFTLKWYAAALSDRLALEALRNSATIAVSTATFSILVGIPAAISLISLPKMVAKTIHTMLFIGLTIPGIVIGLATLVAFVSGFHLLGDILKSLTGDQSIRLSGLGLSTVIAAHTLFCTSLVVELATVRLRQLPRSLIEASADLGYRPVATLRTVTIPHLSPAIYTGFLLSLVLSFDEFIIAFFVSGPEPTLPIYLFGAVRRGATPEINAIVTFVLVISVTCMLVAYVISRPILAAGQRRGTAED
jgi:spermidine/putrescine transport system permease protein